MPNVWVGFDPRETAAFAVTRESIRYFNRNMPINGLVLDDLRKAGLYYRPTEKRLGKLYDVISEHEMATEFAISRFLVPTLNQWGGWSLFMDSDMMLRTNITRVFEKLDKSKAVYCVKHNHAPVNTVKMDDQVQSQYARKNWSSFLIFNCEHPSNEKLTVELINTVPGRDLHAFCWLKDEEIGELPVEWNYLVGHSDPKVEPLNVHYTDGGPWFTAYQNAEYAEEWWSHLHRWAL